MMTAESGCSQTSNPWTVVTIRERLTGELPFEEKSHYLWPSPDANNVPGPDSLVARVRTDENHHPYVEIEDLRNGKAVRLIEEYTFLPHWSPNGKFIGCEVWKSPGQNSELTVLDVATRTILLNPEVRASAGSMKWAPDSRAIAADGVIYGCPRTTLYKVSIPSGTVTILDTLDVLAAYEFSWSPDGQWIVFSRPTKLDNLSEDPVAADIWIADSKDGSTWSLLETSDWVESNPLWITNHTIQIDWVQWDENEPGVVQRVVIELSNSGHTQKLNGQ